MEKALGRSVALIGATGLVGRECLNMLLADPAFSRVVPLTRRPLAGPLPMATLGKLESHVVDFDRPDSYSAFLDVDAVICALGSTIAAAGSRAKFRRVDYEYPLAIARAALEQGAAHFLVVSAMGANPRALVFYSRVKGELEEALLALPFQRISVVRPSFLLGDRQEFRIGEELAKRLAFLTPGKYKPVTVRAVAAVLVAEAREGTPGKRIIESAEIRKWERL
jgi:uncharacterized protein YbjT (DUF2867 family)